MPAYDDSMLDGPVRFDTTRWSVVRRAGASDDEGSADAALDSLCRTYWPAVVAYLRRRGYGREEARDLAQAFFATLVEKDWISRADSERGSFRAFLVTLLRRFAANEAEAAQALKRGGGERFVFLDAGDDGAIDAPDDAATPDEAFDRAWVRALLDGVLARLQEEYRTAGQGARFEQLVHHLVPGEKPPPFAAMAEELGLAEASCRVAVFRARRRYRDLLRDGIAGTVGERGEVDDELAALLGVLSR